MARAFAQVHIAIWSDDDYKALPFLAQWTYKMLVSQRDLNYCGVLPLRPRRWSKLASDLTPEDVEDGIETLAATNYVVVDEDTGELWIRSFMKHDKVFAQKQLHGVIRAAYESIESEHIRRRIYEATPDEFKAVLTDKSPGPEPHGEAADQPAGEPAVQGAGEALVTSYREPGYEQRSTEPKTSSSAPISSDDPRVLRSMEEEDGYFVEGQRLLALYALTHEVKSMRRALPHFVATAYENNPNGPPGLRLVPPECDEPECVSGHIFDAEANMARPCPSCNPRARTA